MKYLTLIVNELCSNGTKVTLTGGSVGGCSILAPKELDPTVLFVAAEKDGLVRKCSYLTPNGLVKHIFQTPLAELVLEELRERTLQIIGREDLISMVSNPLPTVYREFMQRASAADMAALTLLGVVMADYGLEAGQGTLRDPKVWTKVSSQMALEIVKTGQDFGLRHHCKEVEKYLNHYHSLWADS